MMEVEARRNEMMGRQEVNVFAVMAGAGGQARWESGISERI